MQRGWSRDWGGPWVVKIYRSSELLTNYWDQSFCNLYLILCLLFIKYCIICLEFSKLSCRFCGKVFCVSFILLINEKNLSHEFREQSGVRTRDETKDRDWRLIFPYHNNIEILSLSLGLYDGAFNTNQGLKAWYLSWDSREETNSLSFGFYPRDI